MKLRAAIFTLLLMAIAVAATYSVQADNGNPWGPNFPGFCFIYVDENGQTYEVCPTPTPTPTPCDTTASPIWCPEN